MEIIDIAQEQVLAQTSQPFPMSVSVYMVLLLMCWGFVFVVNVQNGYRLFRLSRYLKKYHQRLWVELGFSPDDYGLTIAEKILRRKKWFTLEDNDPELTRLKRHIRKKPTLTVVGMLCFIILLLLGGLYFGVILQWGRR